MLFYFQDEENKDEEEFVNIDAIYISVLMALCHIILEMILIYLEAKAINTSM